MNPIAMEKGAKSITQPEGSLITLSQIALFLKRTVTQRRIKVGHGAYPVLRVLKLRKGTYLD